MMVIMVLLSLLLAAVAVPVAAVLCFGVAALVSRLGFGPSTERITAADVRWLSAQHTNLER